MYRVQIRALEHLALPSFHNWRAYLSGSESRCAYEVPLFTDTSVRFDRFRVGPYTFYKMYPTASMEHAFSTIMLLRVDAHVEANGFDFPSGMDATEDSAYHGGGLDQEIAALVSLAVGIRLMPGSVTREFVGGGDVRGFPTNTSEIPGLFKNPGTRIPFLVREVSLTRVGDRLETFPRLEEAQATALVKAARQYQQAVWYAESDQSQAWLMLVSAIETAADHWWNRRAPAVEILQDGNPRLYDLLLQRGGTDLVQDVAPLVVETMGAGKKFREFIFEFLPGPPDTRPDQDCQFNFDRKNLKKALGTIYGYRSKALHSGKAFPPPMCQTPERYRGGDEPAEIPLGQATGAQGSTWLHTDCPMLLHTFEYIVRASLLQWWQTMAGSDKT